MRIRTLPSSVLHTLVLVTAITWSACGPAPDQDPTANAGQDAPAEDNPELLQIYEADQGDRTEHPIDWSVVSLRDSLRQVRVLDILEAGEAVTSEDYRRAAMVFQHGNDTTAGRMAYDLARTAVELDPENASAKWLMAAAWDRLLMRKGEPQWYGTQFVRDGADDPWRLYDIDTTAVSDSTRVSLGVRTLAESRARVRAMNEGS